MNKQIQELVLRKTKPENRDITASWIKKNRQNVRSEKSAITP